MPRPEEKSVQMIKVGILGSSAIAREHAKAIGIAGGLFSAFASRAKDSNNSGEMLSLFPEARFMPISELLDDNKIDFVVSCLPVNLTDMYFDELISSKKPVLFEKPPFVSNQHSLGKWGDNLINQHWVGFNRRFFSTVQKMRNKLQDHSPLYVELTVSENLIAARKRYPGLSETDYLYYSSSSHLLDLCQYLFGDLTVVRSEELIHENRHMGFFGEFLSAQKVPIRFNIVSNNPVNIGISCVFANGERWVLSPTERLEIFSGYNVNQPTPEFHYKKYSPMLVSSEGVNSNIMPGLEDQMKEFLGQVRTIGSSLMEFQDFTNIVEGIRKRND
jgi:hypothetical protein